MRYILALALLALAACGSADPPAADTDAGAAVDTPPADTGPADTGIDVPAPLCVEGTVRACGCPAGRKGRERCEGATVGYGACDCGTPDAGPVAMDVESDTGAEAAVDAGSAPTDADPPCTAGRTRCGDACVATGSDLRNCGACGAECVIGVRATGVACRSGACVSTCAAGFADCDGNNANGCEVELSRDARNCGACGNQCPSRWCCRRVSGEDRCVLTGC